MRKKKKFKFITIKKVYIIAVLLDLCAKKYITLSKQNDKYIISVLKKPDTYLLYNERYILSSIIT